MSHMRIRYLCIVMLACMLMVSCFAIAEGIVMPSLDEQVMELGSVDMTDTDLNETTVEEEWNTSIPSDVGLSSTEIDFPDDRFREYVLTEFDTNRDGQISDKEAKKVKTIDVTGSNVTTLKGIEKFTKLTTLKCADNNIDTLDLTSNKSLTTLRCEDNDISTLNLGNCKTLLKYAKAGPQSFNNGVMCFYKSSKNTTDPVMSVSCNTMILEKTKIIYSPDWVLDVNEILDILDVKQSINLISKDSEVPANYCIFESSDDSIVKITEKGVLKAVKNGEVTISILTADGEAEDYDIVVMSPPSKVTLPVKKVEIEEDQEYQLEAEVPEYSHATFKWSSSKESVATVDNNGKVKAKSTGTATITVKTHNNKKATCKVTVYAKPTSITLNKDQLTMLEGDEFKLKATLNKGAKAAVFFYSEDPQIADVDEETGEIIAYAKGNTVIHAMTYSGVESKCSVSVRKAPYSIELAQEAYTLVVGDSENLGAVALTRDGEDISDILTYKSSNAKIVTVSDDGYIEGKKAGTATITITASDYLKETCKVTVGKAPTSVSLNKTSLTLKYNQDEDVGEEFQLTAKLNSGAIGEVFFESSNDEVAMVDDAGLVTAVGKGSATITAYTNNNKTAKCKVTVTLSKYIPDEDGEDPNEGEDDREIDYSNCVVVAHRGGLSAGPENTLEAFSNSASTGADMIEMDVRTTKDKIEVINHNASTAGKKIKSYKYEYLLERNPDLCTLDEALDVIYDSGLLLQLELKDTADPTLCVQAVREHNMEDRTIYISFKKDLLKKVRKLEPTATLGFCFEDKIPSDLDKTVKELGISALMVQSKLLTQARLDDWHSKGLLVNVWTINTYDECVKWIDMGVDFITSNYPELAVEARDR